MLDFEIAFELKTIFDEMIDESYPVVQIGYSTFYPSQILKECDPVAYHQAFLDFEDDYLKNKTEE
jgi:hypothetical protein